MHGLAEAARERRQAQRDRLEAAFLRAAEEATVRDAQWRAARSLTAATSAALRASAESLAAARAALEVEVDAFGGFAEGASGVVRDTMEHRRAVLDRVRAEVGRAVAYGWPRTLRDAEVTP